MANNPLQNHFRRAVMWVKLPSSGRWYKNGEVHMNENLEVGVHGLSAIDDLLLNTPDAMFNGEALQNVITSCVPDVKDVHALVQPDIESIFLGIKAATNRGKFEINRRCPSCDHENTFDVQCTPLLNQTTFVEDSDCFVMIDESLKVHIKPYDYDMRTIMLRRQLEEQKIVTQIANDPNYKDDMDKAAALSKSVERTAKLTFDLVANAITGVEILAPKHQMVHDKEHIVEWLLNVDKNTADAIITAVNALNKIGPPNTVKVTCQSCNHEWDDEVAYDPTLFFT